jgi:hypothetical protein
MLSRVRTPNIALPHGRKRSAIFTPYFTPTGLAQSLHIGGAQGLQVMEFALCCCGAKKLKIVGSGGKVLPRAGK